MHAANVPLGQVTELSYWTKQVSGPAHADASYQLPVCLDGFSSSAITPANPTGCVGFTTLVFEPYQHNGSNPVTQRLFLAYGNIGMLMRDNFGHQEVIQVEVVVFRQVSAVHLFILCLV
jgi:hypothetical protein